MSRQCNPERQSLSPYQISVLQEFIYCDLRNFSKIANNLEKIVPVLDENPWKGLRHGAATIVYENPSFAIKQLFDWYCLAMNYQYSDQIWKFSLTVLSTLKKREPEIMMLYNRFGKIYWEKIHFKDLHIFFEIFDIESEIYQQALNFCNEELKTNHPHIRRILAYIDFFNLEK
jgi:hypothetical protein